MIECGGPAVLLFSDALAGKEKEIGRKRWWAHVLYLRRFE